MKSEADSNSSMTQKEKLQGLRISTMDKHLRLVLSEKTSIGSAPTVTI